MRRIAITEAELALELTTGLGGGLNINGVQIPPLTVGKISMLAAINSPLLDFDSKKSFDGKDILDVLYICYAGQEAVQPIYIATRKIKQLEKTQLATVSSKDNYAYMIERIEKHTEAYQQFDKAVFDFADKLGQFSLQDVAEWVVEQLEIGLNGYEMIPGNSEKKKNKKQVSTHSTLIGLFPRLPWWLRIAIMILRKLSGKYHLQP